MLYYKSKPREDPLNFYTANEHETAINAYCETGASRNELCAIAEALHPGRHSFDSWNYTFGQLETLDNQHPRSTELRTNKTLHAAALLHYPARFA